MIQSNELRIGNLVWNEIQEIPCEVNLKIISDCINKIEWKPIPITRDFLLKLGFEEYRNSLDFKIEAHTYWSCGELKEGKLRIKLTKTNKWRIMNFANKSIDLTYIHELQNLYYSITKIELTTK